MDLFCLANFQSGPHCCQVKYDRYSSKIDQQLSLKEALISAICELTMEFGNQGILSDDFQTMSFCMEAYIGDLGTSYDATFAPVSKYEMDVTIDLMDAERPPKLDMTGKYIMVPITCALRDPKEKDPDFAGFIIFTYQANIVVTPDIKKAMEKLDRIHLLQREYRNHPRFAATSCEAYGMDD